MEGLFSLYWWGFYFLSFLGITLSNLRTIHQNFKILRVTGNIGLLTFIISVLLTYLKFGILSTFLLLGYLTLTAIFKQKFLYGELKDKIPQQFKPFYDQLMLGKSQLDEQTIRKSIDKELKKKVSEYIDSL